MQQETLVSFEPAEISSVYVSGFFHLVETIATRPRSEIVRGKGGRVRKACEQ